MKLLTDEQAAWYKEKLKEKKPLREVTKEFNETFNTNITYNQFSYYNHNHHLKVGFDGRFKKGHISKNKGKKQTEYMSAEAIERTKATRFKKGQKSSTQKPIGYMTWVNDTSGKKYLIIKVRNDEEDHTNNFEYAHRLLWQAYYGKIPKGYKVIFLDGNTRNITIDNLMCVSSKVHINMNRKNALFKKIKSSELRRIEVKRLIIEQTLENKIKSRKK